MNQTEQQKQPSSPVKNKESGPTLDIVILLVFGLFMLIFGLLLFKIQTGELPYNSNGTYGLLLVLFSLQIITLGRTHFGDFRRSWALVIIGAFITILGTVTCLIPGLMEAFIRELVGIIILAGSISLFLQLIIVKDQARMWIRTSNILKHLTLALGLVYFIEAILGLFTILPSVTTNLQTAILCIIFGISLFYLIWCLQKVTKLYPPEETTKSPSEQSDNETDKKDSFFLFRDAHISTDVVLTFMFGLIMVLVAILFIPTGIGIFTFSFDSMYGLLLVIMALQVLALGNTPVGEFKRSWQLILVGMIFIAMGIVSCIVPGLLTSVMIILLAIWNLIAGSVGLFKMGIPILEGIRHPPAEAISIPPVVKKMMLTGIILQIMTIFFGINMLLPGYIPGLIILGILFIMGALLIRMAHLLHNPMVQHMNQ